VTRDGEAKTGSLEEAVAQCPATAAGCHILVPGNVDLTAGVAWSRPGSPLVIECANGSDQNLGGSVITFAPKSAPATAFFIQNGSRFIFRNCTLLQSAVQITRVTGAGSSAIYVTAVPHGFNAGRTFVSIQNTDPRDGGVLANNVTALITTTPTPSTFTLDNVQAVSCNAHCGFVNVSGPIAQLTKITGNGVLAIGTCASTCNFVVGQPVTVTGNANGSFNTSAIVETTPSRSTFTFRSTNAAAGTGGTAQQGVNAIVLQGAQGGSIQDSVITQFSGLGWRVGDAADASGLYNECRNSRIFNNQINWEINQLFPAKASNQNVEYNCELVMGNLFSVRGTGVASEVSFFSGDISGNSSPLVQAGDNVNSVRDWTFYNVSMENTVVVDHQIGIQNNAQFSDIHVEGGLANGKSTVAVVDGTIPGACHLLKVGSAFTTQASSWTSTCPPFKFDINGNVGLGTTYPIPGALPSINAPSGWTLCATGSCPVVISSGGILGNGPQAHLGSLENPWLDVTVGRLQARGASPTCFSVNGAGESPSCTLAAGSSDMAGIIVAKTGTGATSSAGTVALKFSSPYGPDGPTCSFTLSNAGGGAWNVRATVMDKGGDGASELLTWDNNGVQLLPATVFRINYLCAGK
jgi:hypothetical protein